MFCLPSSTEKKWGRNQNGWKLVGKDLGILLLFFVLWLNDAYVYQTYKVNFNLVLEIVYIFYPGTSKYKHANLIFKIRKNDKLNTYVNKW